MAGQFSRISAQRVGAGDGKDDGMGDGIAVGEHCGGAPSGDILNMG